MKGRNYLTVYMPTHHRANASGRVMVHVLIAEAALGKPLRKTAPVHHVDGNRKNNERRNLVICQDHTYHMWLHVRTRVVKAGGDPNTQQLCSLCRKPKDFSEFYPSVRYLSGRQNYCMACSRERDKGRRRSGKYIPVGQAQLDWRTTRKGRKAA